MRECFRIPRKAVVTIFILCALPSTCLAQNEWPTRLVYRESAGDSSHLKTYDIVPGNPFLIRLRELGQVQEIHCLDSGRTVRESFRREAGGDEVHAVLNGDRLSFNGTLGGRSKSRGMTLDRAPWYGSILLLRDFLLSGEEAGEFYLTRSETMDVVKLKASREDAETIRIDGRIERAIRVRLSLAGLLSWSWKSFYWFREKDGILLRSLGTRGLNSPEILVELVGESP